ncbi:hypothetical protein C8A03DRAFT_48424 [Achaetomium macrosporum]|uniref:Uncharacterized protein n=1 Tax=Achaetomium macrosporum TaxID=79813 RepID=A0AAN7H5T8_9PEZI|nr:hypothetical protein C8A03DRAFT_48424 [Achaetomium macrosporum]
MGARVSPGNIPPSYEDAGPAVDAAVTDNNGHTILTVPPSQAQGSNVWANIADIAGDEEDSSTANRRKRKYTKKLSEETHRAIWDRLKTVEYQYRIGYLLTLRPSSLCDDLIEFNFNDVTGLQADFVRRYGQDRIIGISNTWQHRCLENIITFVQAHMQETPLFAQCKDMPSIHSKLKRLYDHQLFVELFDFCKGHLDIAGSGSDVQKWCRALFIELLGCAKKHVDWLLLGPSRPIEASADGNTVPNKAWLINRWKNIATAKQWESIRFDPMSVKQVPSSATRRYQPKKKQQFLSVDDDPDTYIPSDTE